MKHSSVIKSAIGTVVLSWLFLPVVSLAHSEDNALAATAGASDLFKVTCSDGSAYLETYIKNKTAGGSFISVQVIKDSQVSNTTDPIAGDSGYSPQVKTKGGDGSYLVMVNHTVSKSETYTLEFHCKNSQDDHTGTSINYSQF